MQGQTRIEFIFAVIIFTLIIFQIVTQINNTFSSINKDYEIDSLKVRALNTLITLVETGDVEKHYKVPIPVDVMLVNDVSGSMDDGCVCDNVDACTNCVGPCGICDAKNASKIFVDELNSTNDRSGLVAFNASAHVLQSLTYNKQDVKDAIDALRTSSSTAIGDGIDNATEELMNNGRSNAEWVQILLTDGQHNRGQEPEPAAQEAANNNIVIYTVGLGDESNFNVTLLGIIASMTGGKYYHVPDSSQLVEIYEEIAFEIKSEKIAVGLIAEKPYRISEIKIGDISQDCDILDIFELETYRLRVYNSTDLLLFCGTETLRPPKVVVSKKVFIGNNLGNVTLELW